MSVYRDFWKQLLTTFWACMLPELEILQRTSQKWKLKIHQLSEVGFYLTHRFIWIVTLGFGVWTKFLFQKLSVISKSPTLGQFCKSFQNMEHQLCQPPPLCKKIFFDMPFLMSQECLFQRGLNFPKSQKSVPHDLCGTTTISLKCYTPYHAKSSHSFFGTLWWGIMQPCSSRGCEIPEVKVGSLKKWPLYCPSTQSNIVKCKG